MVQLSNIPARRPLPPEPVLPPFHKLTRTTLDALARQFLETQEQEVFKAFARMVANRSATDAGALEDLRGSLAREIRGLMNLRAEFEPPLPEESRVDIP